ncbi:MAG: hypothetical protein K0T99_00695 [Alphaproteobacteria bacterium]|nr:hypothetical protein [Alphaproteobacteria bacterium]
MFLKPEKDKKEKGFWERFFDRHPTLKRIKNFISHDTIWRLVAVATAAAATVLTGGAAIPAAALALTVAGSFISVAAKTWQLRGVERRRLQKKFVKSIGEKDKKLDGLRKTHSKVLSHVEKGNKPKKTHKFKTKEPNKTRSFFKVLRDVGLENAVSVFSVAASGNPAGALAYVVSVGLATANIKSEFGTRVKYDMEQDQAKKDMNEICEKAGIPPFKNTKELHAYFKEQMIENEAKTLLCDVIGSKQDLGPEKTLEIFNDIKQDVAKNVEFESLPQRVTLTRKFFDAINPFKAEVVKDYDTTPEDDVISYSVSKRKDTDKTQDTPNIERTRSLSPSPTPKQKKSRTLSRD